MIITPLYPPDAPMTSDPTLLKAFAPTGKLRASINLGNPILANRNAATGEAGGVSVDLAREFAARLGVDTDLVVFDTAAKSVEAVTTEAADIGFRNRSAARRGHRVHGAVRADRGLLPGARRFARAR